MKKRLKSLLALCMAGIMMFAMTTGIASADETQTTSKIYTYDKIDSNTAYYPGDIVTPENTNSSSGCKEFFVVKYYEINKLEDTDAYRTVLYDNVVGKNFMTDDEFGQLDGVYRYWDLKDDAGKSVWPQYTVLCDYTEGTWSVVTNPTKQMTDRADDYSFYEYDPRISEYNPETSNENPVCNAFYSFAYGDSETNLYGSRALELPSVDKLFGEGYEFGYHYSLNKKRSVAWNVSGEYSDNTPSGITLVNPTEEGKLIDIIYGRKTQTEEPQTEQGGKPISTYSYSTIKDALLIKPVANKYTVNFDANGGSGDMELTAVTSNPNTTGELTYDKNSKLPENKFTREGYNFNGWEITQCTYQEFNGSGDPIKIATSNEPYKTLYTDEDHYIPTRNNETVTLQAQWVKDGEYTVNYDTNGGSAVQGKTNVSWDDKNLNDVTPTKNGYTFKGWKCGDTEVTADTTYGELAKDYTVETVTLTAQWEKAAAPATGDDTNTTLPIALLILSIIGIAGAGLYRRNHVK